MKIGFSGDTMRFGVLRRACLLVGIMMLVLSFESYGQGYRNQFVPYSSVGFGIGTASYYGDMAPISRVVSSTFNMMRWNVSGEYTRHFSPRFAARASLTWARLAGDDFVMNRGGMRPNHSFFVRNLHFRNDVKEFAAVGIVKLTPDGRSADRRPEFGAYLFAGVGLFAHNPKARLPVDPAEPDKKQSWQSLQPLGTEGQGQPDHEKLYSLVSFAVPVGFGLRYKITPKFDIGAELGFRFTTSDYLDDVSKGYPADGVLQSAESIALSNRSLEVQPARKPKFDRTEILRQYLGLEPAADPFAYVASNPGVVTRGDSPRSADKYMTGTIKLVYVIGPTIKCPPLK